MLWGTCFPSLGAALARSLALEILLGAKVSLLCWQCPLVTTRWRRFPPCQRTPITILLGGGEESWAPGSFFFFFVKIYVMGISRMYKAYEPHGAENQSTPCLLSTPAVQGPVNSGSDSEHPKPCLASQTSTQGSQRDPKVSLCIQACPLPLSDRNPPLPTHFLLLRPSGMRKQLTGTLQAPFRWHPKARMSSSSLTLLGPTIVCVADSPTPLSGVGDRPWVGIWPQTGSIL